MRVLGLRRHSSRTDADVERMYGPAEVTAFVARSDFVVVTAASNDQSRGLLGHDAFRGMKSTAYCVCVSRGGIADTALLTALRKRRIAGPS